MRLRRMYAVYAITLAVCLLALGNHARQETTPTAKRYDGELTIAAPHEQTPGPSPVTLATPKGRVTVQPAVLGRYDIPSTALIAYQRAADILAEVKPGCGLEWPLLAAIGRVESNHGEYGASSLGTDGVSTPQVVGVPLNGQGPVATIADTDSGQLDGDPRWDHAVGPMQFIPSTWDVVGVDGDGDGTRSIDDIDDAALAAGIYLCAGSENLSADASVEAALHRYNDSDSYVALVMAYERKYEGGNFTVTSPDGGLVVTSAALVSQPLAGAPLNAITPAEARTRARIKADAAHAAAAVDRNGGRTPGISSATAQAAVAPAAVTTPSEARGAQTAAAASGATTPAAPGGPSPSASGTTTPATSGPASPSAPGTVPSTPAGTTPSSPNATPGTGSTAPSSSDPSTSTGTPTPSSPSTGSGSTGGTTSEPAPSTPGSGGTTSSEPTPSQTTTETQTPSQTPTQTQTPELPPCDPTAPPNPDPTATPTCVPPATTQTTTQSTAPGTS